MAKKLNKPAQAARDAFIQRKVDEADNRWREMWKASIDDIVNSEREYKALLSEANGSRDVAVNGLRELGNSYRELEKRESDLTSMLSLKCLELDDERKSHRRVLKYLLILCLPACLAAGIFIGIKLAQPKRTPAFITTPINTPIVAYTENGWHQAYVDISGNIRSMENGQRIMNATSWMKP